MKVSNTNYSEFTPIERINLTLAAMARNDSAEMTSLINSTDVKHYRAIDHAFASPLHAIVLVQHRFSSALMFHAGKLDVLDALSRMTLLITCIVANGEEEKAQFQPQQDKLINNQVFHLTHILAIFCGAINFCKDTGIDFESFFNATPSMVNISEVVHRALTDTGGLESAFDEAMIASYKDEFLNTYHALIPVLE